MKIETTPAVLAKIRLYADPFEKFPPAIFAHFPPHAPELPGQPDAPVFGGTDPVFPFAAASDRGLGILLLTAALHHPGGEAAVARVLSGLYRAHGNDIFKLNRLPFEPLRDQIAALAGDMDEAARNRIPGILRSACDFFYRVGPLGPWLASAPDWEARAGELCGEIYWMGAHSRARTKARLFFWLACRIPGFATRPEMRGQAAAFQGPISDGHMRFWIDILKPGRTAGGRTPEERVTAFAGFARAVFPEAPWRLFQPLDNFLRRDGAGGYRCRNVQGGCRPCPLSSLCPAALNFIPGEGS